MVFGGGSKTHCRVIRVRHYETWEKRGVVVTVVMRVGAVALCERRRDLGSCEGDCSVVCKGVLIPRPCAKSRQDRRLTTWGYTRIPQIGGLFLAVIRPTLLTAVTALNALPQTHNVVRLYSNIAQRTYLSSVHSSYPHRGGGISQWRYQ